MTSVELYDLKTGNVLTFKSKKECSKFLKMDYKKFSNASYYKPNHIFKKRYSLINQPIKPKVKREKRHGEYKEWKLLRFAEFPRVLIAEIALPFYNKDKFEVIYKAGIRYYGKKNCSIYIDEHVTEKFTRSKARLQVLVKTEKEEPFSVIYDFLDKMEMLIEELNIKEEGNDDGDLEI